MADLPAPEVRTGFLRDCLVEGDSAQEKRVRQNKQRALLISIVLQILIVAALVLFPLLSKGENIARRVVFYPTVPYASGGGPPHPRNPARPVGHHPTSCRFCAPPSIPRNIAVHDSPPIAEPGEPIGPGIPGVPPGVGIDGGLTPPTVRSQPVSPEAHRTTTSTRRRVSEPVQAAMLIRRVEPLYPQLAVQLRREGRVELHAVISTDGSIQSLEVISGDPLLIRSALAAVREWRYRPTILNGQPVEVDTHITVIYTLSH
jgi:periplasmic protein TonB